MSDLYVELTPITQLLPHPNADRLEIAVVQGTQSLVPVGEFVEGEKVLFFPPDMLIPPAVSEALGVQNYLKNSDYEGERCKCRIAACRLRGVPSYGFIVKRPLDLPLRKFNDFSDLYGAIKYDPPINLSHGDVERPDLIFHQYTSIQHYWRYKNAIADGTKVRITEKLHGSNSRVGLVKTDDGFEFMAGSHRTRRKEPEEGQTSLYWTPLDNPKLRQLLKNFSAGHQTVIVFGEIYGQSIQDMDYGTKDGYRVFDISVDGQYLDWAQVEAWCNLYDIPTVPLLYLGPISKEIVEEHTYGPTTLANPDGIKSRYKGREGCVITPIEETFYAPTGGRLILKSVSADYLDRKGATDNE